VFDIVWTGFTVLWFAQIFPKHLAATNPDRYLGFLRGPLFPIVEVVRRIGVSQPAEWVAKAVERRLAWPLTQTEIEEAVLPREESLAGAWRELIPETPERGAPTPRDLTQPGGG
jgi:Mg2+/Co2+ transporter CorB